MLADGHMRRRLLEWYDLCRRDLPWRRPSRTGDPWAVLVAEVMLQQTTVATVADRYGELLARFPTPAELAAAPLDALLHAWQGLGYYRRARQLHACARAIVERHDGRVPAQEHELAALPGVGPYTAAAVAAIAFGQPVVPVDGNVARVLARLRGIERPVERARAELRQAAAAFAAPDRAGDLAQALIELGALVCRPRRPACCACPLASDCRARATGDPERLPIREPKKARRVCHTVAFLAVDAAGRVLLRRRRGPGPLTGLFELPSGPWTEAGWQRATQPPLAARWQRIPGEVRHLFTHIDLRVTLHRADVATAGPQVADGAWYDPAAIAGLALPTLTRRLLRHGGYGVGLPSSGRQASTT